MTSPEYDFVIVGAGTAGSACCPTSTTRGRAASAPMTWPSSHRECAASLIAIPR
jgi:choline dehydrogenase-like flavoprotein